MITSVLQTAAGAPVGPELDAVPVTQGRVDAFEASMARHGTVGTSPEALGVNATAATSQTVEADMDAQSRARRGLDLEGGAPAERGTRGDVILDGLEKMRGVFDAREVRVSELISRSGTDAANLMVMQMEMTNFSLMVDVSSKLTGKATQSFDTLMKGQ